MRLLFVIALLLSCANSLAQGYYQTSQVANVYQYNKAYYQYYAAFVAAEQQRHQVVQQTQVIYIDRPVQQPAQVVYIEKPINHPIKTVEVEESPRSEYIKECQRYGMSKSKCISIWDDLPMQEDSKKAVTKSKYRPARDDEILVEYAEKPKPIVFKHESKPVVIPKDVELTSEQERLTKLGIPIISGIRSAKKQESLKDHKGVDGLWYTAAGNPVAIHSNHLTGNAIDTGPLNAKQRRILAENGWFQPIPQQDPNHWEKVNPTLVATK